MENYDRWKLSNPYNVHDEERLEQLTDDVYDMDNLRVLAELVARVGEENVFDSLRDRLINTIWEGEQNG